MNDIQQLYQALTLVAVVLFFNFLERRRPGYAVDRKRELRLNILALLIVIIAGEAWKTLILNGLNVLNVGKVLSLSGLHRLPSAVKILLGLIFADFCLYWVHWAMHRPRLWPTHAFHHSIAEVWWLSGARTSVTHLFLFAFPQILLAYYLFRLSPVEAGVAFSIGVVVNVWIHINVQVNLGPLEWILITPDYHRIHHGAKGLSRKNLGFVFTIWDRIFGTYYDPHSEAKDYDLFAVSTRKGLLRMVVGI
jgi:sterol desaturase/sphingolipid hydroxylase (fatty acid hydroxylase superfamily)